MVGEVGCRVAQALGSGSFHAFVFAASHLSLSWEMSLMVYQSVVLGVLLCGDKTWAPWPSRS